MTKYRGIPQVVVSARRGKVHTISNSASRGRRPFRNFPGFINGYYRTVHCNTPEKQILLTSICHFTKQFEAFPIPDVSVEKCAIINATQIIARHGSGSTLITDQGMSFTSTFFQETCKILEVRKVRMSAYHAMSNGMVERFHRVPQDSIAHDIDSTGKNWDVMLPLS